MASQDMQLLEGWNLPEYDLLIAATSCQPRPIVGEDDLPHLPVVIVQLGHVFRGKVATVAPVIRVQRGAGIGVPDAGAHLVGFHLLK